MTVPIAEELNVRERVERLFQTSASDVGLEVAVASLEHASAGLVSAIARFVSFEFEIEGPSVTACAPTDMNVVADDQIIFQFERALPETKFRCWFSGELSGVLLRSGFGGRTAFDEASSDCGASEFCNFFVSNVALAIIRELVSSITGSRAQSITFEKVIEHEDGTLIEPLKEPGFLATWDLVSGEARHPIVVYLPNTEFHRLVVCPVEEAEEVVDEADVSAWSSRMQASLTAAEVQLSAIMKRPDMPLEQLSNLEIGDVVEFADPQSTSVLLECEGEPLFACEIGQKNGFFAVHIRNEIRRPGSV